MRRALTFFHVIAARAFSFGAWLSLALMFLMIFGNAVRRYTIGKSFEWGEELPVYLAIYGVMFGAALGYLQDRHVRLAIFVDPLPEKLRKWVFAGVDLIMIGAGFMLARSGWLFVEKRGNVESSGLIGTTKDIAEATGFEGIIFLGQMYPWQFALCLGGIMMAIAAFLKFLERLIGIEPDKQEEAY